MSVEGKIIGAGLAGCECAWILAQSGVEVTLCEMKPGKFSPAHKNPDFAELICSNSLKASRVDSAAGLLKEEMRRLGSLLVPVARECAVEAGGALAVDREKFSKTVTEKIKAHPLIKIVSGEVTEINPEEITVIASGPLTSDNLAENIKNFCGDYLNFYDAVAPIVTRESIDFEKVFFATRYDKGDPDYINCPMDKETYLKFYNELITAETAPLHAFDKTAEFYEGCMPVEVLAKRGEDSLRFANLKPVGLTDPKTGRRPYAVVQLRKENREGTLYNLVGFQTNLKFSAQKNVFSLIPGLENAEFMRYGVMHRNSYICSPKLLNKDYSLKENPNVFFAGQITGVEGYMESAMSGILAGLNIVRRLKNQEPLILPKTTMCGALTYYITDSFNEKNFQPMGANMGILPELGERFRDKKLKYAAYAQRSLDDLNEILLNI
jgi:methylenetetrahydrofolate--tRNA-(uracil-5-)-methyltransferase